MVRLFAVAALAAGCVEPLQVLTPWPDAGAPDAGGPDAGPPDSGVPDAGMPDAGGGPFLADQIAVASAHACAVRAGALFCWGNNMNGQLGLGTVQSQPSPVQVGVDTDWAEVMVGYSSSCARKTSGTIWCWGDNSFSQLGLGTSAPAGISAPQQVPLGFSAQTLALHFEHVCVLDPTSELWCWGSNTESELGLDDPMLQHIDQPSPQHVSPGTAWRQVDTGNGHTCGIHADGTLWCWGRNTMAQVGLDAGAPIQIVLPTQIGTDTDWSEVHDGSQESTCALKTDGSLWCWGYTYESVFETATFQYGPKRIGTETGWTQIQMETYCICTRDPAAHLWCRGRNAEGELGTGDGNPLYTPTQIDNTAWSTGAIGRFFRCAVRASDNQVFCTGANDDGQLGVGDTQYRNVLTPVLLP
jgi:alpha-tubulin suppressor-like RCC1 family protein